MELPLLLPDDELLALDEALDRLATVDSRAADVVKLRFFVGLTQEQAGKKLGISLATAERRWSFARAWFSRKCREHETDRTDLETGVRGFDGLCRIAN